MHIHKAVGGFGIFGDYHICAECGKGLGYGVPFLSWLFGRVVEEDSPSYMYWSDVAARRHIIWKRTHHVDN